MAPNRTSSKIQGRLLVIDDEPDLREVLVDLLADSIMDIHQACDGLDGISKIKTLKFDAVLSDEKMPKKTGLDVLRWIREQGLQIPFIIHTGYGQKEVVTEAQKLGVYAVIDKPWDEKTLIRTVQEAIKLGMGQKS